MFRIMKYLSKAEIGQMLIALVTIVVLDDGKVVGQGTHKELLDNCDVYRQIAESQLSQSELTA